MHHYRKTIKKYQQLALKDKSRGINCGLCEAIDPEAIIGSTKHLSIVRNRVPYDVFDGLETTGEHYLIIPKRHVESIGDFTDDEKLEMMEVIATYEALGFSVYARSTANIHRSQSHQHTHLIQLATKAPKFLFTSERPYMLFHG
jgi:diadenosine tetraphosphate (Ap4A) HIT family hydrolase